MTTRIAIVILALMGSISCVTGRSARRGGLPPSEVAKLPEPVAEAYTLFAQKCSRCHTLSRPLSAGIDDSDHWEKYVGRMRRQRGSGISEADGDKILKFLKYYTAQRTGQQP
ncbi:MAG: hypothetical protein AAF449_02015 [Myxococcota bacterium]